MEEFLASVEKRAFQMAHFATGNIDEAMDIVQDSMLQLVRTYSNKPKEELRPLFFQILQNRIRDWYRRQSVRNRLYSLWSNFKNHDEGLENPIDLLPDTRASKPEDGVAEKFTRVKLEKVLKELPLRQQQAFLLRAWEELSISETALAMKCSEGSVKSHYFRALQTLREKLEGLEL